MEDLNNFLKDAIASDEYSEHTVSLNEDCEFIRSVLFENGYINLDGILSETRSYAPETLITGQREFEDITYAMGKPKQSITYYEYDKSWDFELAEFIGAIRGNSSIINGTSHDALEIMKITDHIYKNSLHTKTT